MCLTKAEEMADKAAMEWLNASISLQSLKTDISCATKACGAEFHVTVGHWSISEQTTNMAVHRLFCTDRCCLENSFCLQLSPFFDACKDLCP